METIFGLFHSFKYSIMREDGLNGYRDYCNWYSDQDYYRPIDRIIMAMMDSSVIHFTFDGYNHIDARYYENSYTTKELWLIINIPEFWNKSEFHQEPDGYWIEHIHISQHDQIEMLKRYIELRDTKYQRFMGKDYLDPQDDEEPDVEYNKVIVSSDVEFEDEVLDLDFSKFDDDVVPNTPQADYLQRFTFVQDY